MAPRKDKTAYNEIQSLLDGNLPHLKENVEVTCDTANHLSVLSQLHGSVWPRVLPFSIAYSLLAVLVYCLKHNFDMDLSVDTTGLNYLSTLVAFYEISATIATIEKYVKIVEMIRGLNANCIKLAHGISLFGQNDLSKKAKDWRYDVFYHIFLLQITTLGALEYQASGVNVWELMDLPETERKYLKDIIISWNKKCKEEKVKTWFKGESRLLTEENFRAPMLMALKLRLAITSWKTRSSSDENTDEEVENCETPNKSITDPNSLQYVCNYVKNFYSLKALVQTQIPFPLVKMRRTLLYFWLFCLPLGFLSVPSIGLPPLVFLIFVITSGFLGLELVVMEIEDPFGLDPNDLNDVGRVKDSMENVLFALYQIDGRPQAAKLRKTFRVFCDGKINTK